jgi:hypothetical protein
MQEANPEPLGRPEIQRHQGALVASGSNHVQVD